MAAFSSGEYALFRCDRCGFRGDYRLSVRERETGLRVHERCMDEPLIYRKFRAEGQGLRDPRPDDYVVEGLFWTADSMFYTADSTQITADAGAA
jgi:hypothetical protein